MVRSAVPVTIHLPAPLWHAVQALASHESDAPTVILRAVEKYVATAARNQTHQSGKYRALVQALRTPVADFHLSTRPASALQRRNIRYVYELVQKSPTDLFALPNFGKKSLKKIEEKLATFGLTLGMPVEDDTYRRTIVATVAANLHPTKG